MTFVVYLYDKCRSMKKRTVKKPGKYKSYTPEQKFEEPEAQYYTQPIKKQLSLKDFTYNDFKKIAAQVPFTQSEWAMVLHLSERTLQRYAKDNSTFAPINAERALMVAKVIKEGINTFGDGGSFYEWIKQNPYMLEGALSFESLTTTEGIQKVMTQLGRIQHGILA